MLLYCALCLRLCQWQALARWSGARARGVSLPVPLMGWQFELGFGFFAVAFSHGGDRIFSGFDLRNDLAAAAEVAMIGPEALLS